MNEHSLIKSEQSEICKLSCLLTSYDYVLKSLIQTNYGNSLIEF